MLYYLNRGLILDQAIVALLKGYFSDLNFSKLYKNFKVSVEDQHPFARLYANDGKGLVDSFPCIVVSTIDDSKPSDFINLAPHIEAVDISASALESILTVTRDVNGEARRIQGLSTVADPDTIAALRKIIADKGVCYGLDCRIRRHDTIGVEVWSTNNQLKNEMYEAVRLYIACYLRELLQEQYPFFAIELFDHTIRGSRGGNYNMDFAQVLYGSHISFEVDYMIDEVIIDSEANNSKPSIINSIMAKAVNHSL